MADYTVPVDWKFDGDSKDSSTYLLPGHTSAEPRWAIFDRKVPSNTPGGTTVPWSRIRFFRGVLDSDGNLIQSRVTNEYQVKWPTIADSADVIADMALMATLIGDVDLQNDLIVEQILPRN